MSARAVLRLDMEGSADIVRMFGTIAGAQRSAQAAMNADARRGAQERTRSASAEARATAATAREAARARERAEREASRAVQAEARKREQIEKQSARERERAEKAATRTTEREAKARTRAEGTWAREVDTIHRGLAAAREREERRVTRTAEREAKNRERIAAREGRARDATGRRIGSTIGQVGSAAVGYGRQMHGDMQDARRRRAVASDTLGQAVGQAGGDAAEIRQRMARMTAFAAEHGIDVNDLASTALRGQGEFNTLGNRHMTAAQRGEQFESFLADAREGANTGGDMSQHVRLSGMLRGRGFDDATRLRALRFVAGAASEGAVEEGTLTAQALPSLVARMSSAHAENGETQSQAQFRALTQAVAELEVARGFGNSPTTAGNAMRNVNRALGGDVAQGKIRTNILNASSLTQAQRTTMEAELFEDDPARRGHRRLRSRYQDALALSSRATELSGSPDMFANIFAGGGHGNPQALQANWRSLLASFNMRDAEGVTGIERVRRMSNVAETSLSDTDAARLANNRETGDLATLTRSETTRDNALTDNTSAVVGLSASIQNWQTAHPFAAPAAASGGGILATIFGPAIATRVGGFLGGGVAGAALPGVGAALTVAEAGADIHEGRSAGNVAGGVLDNIIPAGGFFRRILGGGGGSAAAAAGAAAGSPASPGGAPTVTLSTGSVQALAAALRAAPLVATIDPHTANHAASTAASGHSPPPPAARR